MQSAPDYAIQIWMEDDNIKICFNDQGHTHVVSLDSGRTQCPSEADAWALVHHLRQEDRGPSDKPMSLVRGWHALRRILKDRAQQRTTPSFIGQTRSITQDQLDRMIRSYGGEVKVVGKKRTVSDVSLEDLGL